MDGFNGSTTVLKQPQKQCIRSENKFEGRSTVGVWYHPGPGMRRGPTAKGKKCRRDVSYFRLLGSGGLRPECARKLRAIRALVGTLRGTTTP